MERYEFIAWISGLQWIAFFGICPMIYFWVDKKTIAEKISQVIFIVLGIAAGIMLIMKKTPLPENLPDSSDIPMRLFHLFSGLTITGILALIALLLSSRKPSWSKVFNGMLVGLAIALFFTAYYLQKTSI